MLLALLHTSPHPSISRDNYSFAYFLVFTFGFLNSVLISLVLLFILDSYLFSVCYLYSTLKYFSIERDVCVCVCVCVLFWLNYTLCVVTNSNHTLDTARILIRKPTLQRPSLQMLLSCFFPPIPQFFIISIMNVKKNDFP